MPKISPINLNPEAAAEWDKYLEATSIEDQIYHLERFIGVCVKHKGVEKHLSMAKKKLKKLKARKEKLKLTTKKGGGDQWLVPKGEDAQITIVGITNSGKSSLINALSNSEAARVGSYPFTTVRPEVTTVTTKGARIQLVELPALVRNSYLGEMHGKLVLAGVRSSDAVIIVIDLSRDPIEQLRLILNELDRGKIRVNKSSTLVTIEKTGSGNIQVFNEHYYKEPGGKEAIIELLRSKGFTNAIVRFYGPVFLQDLLDALDSSVCYIPGMICATKGDFQGSKKNYQKLIDFLTEQSEGNKFKVVATSCEKKKGLADLPETIFSILDKIRVYTKQPDGKVAERPIVLPKNSTVADATKLISKEMVKHFRFARIWGTSANYDGEKVGIDHILMDGDIIQIYA